MTPDIILSIDQALPLFSNTKSQSPPQEKNGSASSISSKENKPVIGDTVSISSQSRQALTDVKKDKTLLKEGKKTEANRADNSVISDAATATVEFVYNLKGDLVTKYLDSSSRIIYQTPSKLMLSMNVSASKSDSSVSMKA